MEDTVKSFKPYKQRFLKMRVDNKEHGYTEKIKDAIIKLGANLVGVADTEPLKRLKLNPPNLLDSFPRAISIALRLPSAAFEQIIDRPTPLTPLCFCLSVCKQDIGRNRISHCQFASERWV